MTTPTPPSYPDYWHAYQVAHDTILNARVRMAVLVHAQTVLTNPTPPANQADHVALAQKILAEQNLMTQLFTDSLVLNNITQDNTDADIQTAVGQVWDMYVGKL